MEEGGGREVKREGGGYNNLCRWKLEVTPSLVAVTVKETGGA